MRIKKIEVKNIYPFRDVLVSFDEPIVILLGPNGVGKTTLAKIGLNGALKLSGKRLDDRAKRGEAAVLVDVEDKEFVVFHKGVQSKASVSLGKRPTTIEKYYKTVLGYVPTTKEMEAILALSFFSNVENKLILKKESVKDFILGMLGVESFMELLSEVRRKLEGKKERLDEKRRFYEIQHAKIDREIRALREKVEKERKAVSKYKKELEELEGKREELREAVERLSAEVNRLAGEIEALKDIEKEYAKLEEKLARIDENIYKIVSELGERAVRVKRFYEIRGYEVLRRMAEILAKASHLGLEADPERIASMDVSKDIERLEAEKDKIQTEMSELKGTIKTIERRLEELKRRISELRAEIGVMRSEFASIGCDYEDPNKVEECVENVYREKKALLDTLETKKTKLRGEKRNVEEIIKFLEEELEKKTYKCPVCRSELTEDKIKELLEENNRRLKELVEEIRKTEKEIDALKEGIKRIEEIKKKLEVYKRDVEELKRLRGERAEKDKIISTYKERVRELSKRLEGIHEELKRLKEIDKIIRSVREHYHRRKEAYELSKEIPKDIPRDLLERIGVLDESIILNIDDQMSRYKEYKAKIIELRKKREKRRGLSKKLENEKRELEEIERRISELRNAIGNLEGSIERDLSRIEELGKEKEKYAKKKREVEKAIQRLSTLINSLSLRKKDNAIKRLEAAILKDTIDRINKALVELVDKANEGAGISRKRIKVTIDEKGSVAIKALRAEEDTALERDLTKLSAGEQMFVSVLFMLAFRKAISGDVRASELPIVLDEPTANADANTRLKVIDLVETLIDEGIIPQVIITTHDQELVDMIVSAREDVKVIRLEKTGSYTVPKDLTERSLPPRVS